MTRACTIVGLLTLLASQVSRANVLGLFPAGTGCKSAAMETSLDCSEPQTLFYNPAVMSSLPNGFAAELGAAHLAYSYEHPDFDPVRVDLNTPMFSEGWKGAFLEDRAAWGFAVMPGSMAELDIKGLPRRVSGSAESLRVNATRKMFHVPIGGSYTLPEYSLSLGASVIYTYDHRTLKGTGISDPSTRLVDLKAQGHFFRPVIGATWRSLGTDFGSGYMFPLTKKFTGKTKLASEPDSFKTELVDYDPGVAMLSVRREISGVTLSGNANRLFAAKGQTIPRDGVNRKTTQADFKDTNHYGVRAAYKTESYGEFSLGVAYLDSYWGAGYYYKDADGFAHHELGHLFGTFNAIPVRNQALTWRQSFASWQTHFGIFRSAGATTVAPGGDNPGYYQIEFVSLTCGIRRII